MKPLLLLLCVLLCSCSKQEDNDPRRNLVTVMPTNAVGKWETLMVEHVRRFGSPAVDTVWPANRDEWKTGKGFEFRSDGTLRVYSYTNATLTSGPGSFSLTATGQYTLASGVLQVKLNNEVASTPFPPVPRTDPGYARLPERVKSEIGGAIYLALTNEAGAAGTIGLVRVSKFKFE